LVGIKNSLTFTFSKQSNMSLKIASTVTPANRPSLEEWFKQLGVSTNVRVKNIPPDRHVFDIKKFKADLDKRDFTLFYFQLPS
jgi:hypothetical protein